MVVRSGWPPSPKTSRNATGHASGASAMPSCLRAREHLLGVAARPGEAGEVALHVREEDRHADAAEPLREHAERDRLAGAGRAGDEAVAVRERGEEGEVLRSRPSRRGADRACRNTTFRARRRGARPSAASRRRRSRRAPGSASRPMKLDLVHVARRRPRRASRSPRPAGPTVRAIDSTRGSGSFGRRTSAPPSPLESVELAREVALAEEEGDGGAHRGRVEPLVHVGLVLLRLVLHEARALHRDGLRARLLVVPAHHPGLLHPQRAGRDAGAGRSPSRCRSARSAPRGPASPRSSACTLRASVGGGRSGGAGGGGAAGRRGAGREAGFMASTYQTAGARRAFTPAGAERGRLDAGPPPARSSPPRCAASSPPSPPRALAAACSDSPCQELGEKLCALHRARRADACKTQVEDQLKALDPPVDAGPLRRPSSPPATAPAGGGVLRVAPHRGRQDRLRARASLRRAP